MKPASAAISPDRGLAGLRAERVAALLRQRVGQAQEQRAVVVQPTDRVEGALDRVGGVRLDQQPCAVRSQRLADPPSGTERVAHVVQAVEGGHQLVSGAREGLCRTYLEGDPVRDTRIGGLLARELDRLRVVVRADDRALRKGLAEQHRRRPEPAADVGDPCSARQLLHNAVEGRDPGGHEVGDVARTVERVAPDEDVVVVLVPADALTRAERLGDARLGAQVAEHDAARRGQVGPVRVGETELLLRGEGELRRCRVVGDVAGGGLAAQPLGEIAPVAPGPLREVLRGRGTSGERTVEAEPAADHHTARAPGGCEITDEPAEELVELAVVYVLRRFRHVGSLGEGDVVGLARAVVALTPRACCGPEVG